MSFGSGSIPGYLQRLRNTKIRRANRQKEFKGGNDYSNVKPVKTAYNFPEISNYNLAELKKNIKTRAEKDQKNRIFFIILTIVCPVIILFAIFLLY